MLREASRPKYESPACAKTLPMRPVPAPRSRTRAGDGILTAAYIAERIASGTPLGRARNLSKLEATESKAEVILLTGSPPPATETTLHRVHFAITAHYAFPAPELLRS